jgi:radical SAM superfamily enzyme YgiQ (UPF0313 family)
MKVALVNPPPKKIVEVRYDAPSYPHIGLGYVAGYLESRGLDVSVVDSKLERLSLEDTVYRIVKESPQIVGLTAFTHEIDQAAKVASAIKSRLPGAVMGIGGIHATALPKDTLQRYSVFDVAFHGEGEITFHEFAVAVTHGRSWEGISGIAFRSGNTIAVNPPRDRLTNLDELPFPAWHKFPLAKEYHVITERGCPFSCNFCMRPNGTIVRKRSPESIIEELERVIHNYHPAWVLFCDETFTLDKERVYQILDIMIRRGLHRKIKWYVQTHVNTVDEPILKKMKEAGCYSVGFGIESGNPEILEKTKKGISLQKAVRAVELAKKVGLVTEGYFIIGHPNETPKTIKDTINFAARLNPHLAVFGIMVPYPGTEVYEMAQKGLGGYRVLSSNWSDYNKQIGNALEFTHLDRKRLELYQLRGYMQLYLRNGRFLDLLKFVIRYRNEGLAFLKKTIRQLVFNVIGGLVS